jgi:transcription-repair coupling factor (superfamily II helicase)
MSQNQEKYSLRSLVAKIPDRQKSIECTGLSGSSAAFLASRIYLENRIPVFFIVPSTKDAERLLADLQYFLKQVGSEVLYFPPYNISPFRDISYHNETAARRIETLYKMMTAESPPVAVTTVEACLQKIIPGKELSNYAELIMAGEEIDRDYLVEKLIAGGYVRTAIVEDSVIALNL